MSLSCYKKLDASSESVLTKILSMKEIHDVSWRFLSPSGITFNGNETFDDDISTAKWDIGKLKTDT